MTSQTTQSNDYVDFESLQKLLGISDMTLFVGYLKEVYKDLADRTENKKKGISKVTFYDYVKLPIFIAEKLFSALDTDNDSLLNAREFVEGLQDLYMGDFETTFEIIFNLLDFDKDGKINKDDVRVLLSYLPLKTDNSPIEYKIQMESQSEIDDILNSTFERKALLNIEEFRAVVENRKSDVYLQILCFLYQKKPFKNQNITTLKASKKKVTFFTPRTKASSPNIIPGVGTPSKKLLTPNRKSTLSPAEAFIRAAQLQENILGPKTKKSFVDENTPQVSGMKGMIRMNNKKIPQNTEKYTKTPKIAAVIKESKDTFNSPSSFLKSKKSVTFQKKESINDFKLDSHLVQMEKLNLNLDDDSSSDEESDNNSNRKTKTPKKKNYVTFENWVYKITESNKLIKYYLVVIGKDIYYYKNSKKDELLGMHNLSGCYIRENGDKIISGNKFYCFQILFPSKKRNYYTETKQIAADFVINLKKQVGYLNFFDYYEMLDDIGEGKFGLVKLGLHKSTQERVAIKIIKKEAMQASDFELVKTEIDIMKLCHHPNIVRLLDHFENAEYIFIVMEYLAGGSLESYLKKNKFNFTEKRAAEMMFQICEGMQYLHHYGVLHRDLKPENIMMTECSEKGQIKIMDFGLSKIMGPQERVVDGFGTLSFVAPEVLVRTPYNKQIDIWSIGIILYYMLSGTLPFDDDDDNEEVIAKMIVFIDTKFPKEKWKNRSDLVIDFIKQCLNKDPEKRITIDELINHEWFKSFNLKKEGTGVKK